jgi:shikimate dehydrogenase
VPFKEEAFRLADATHGARRGGRRGEHPELRAGDGMLGDNTDGAGLVRDLKHNLGCDPAGAASCCWVPAARRAA